LKQAKAWCGAPVTWLSRFCSKGAFGLFFIPELHVDTQKLRGGDRAGKVKIYTETSETSRIPRIPCNPPSQIAHQKPKNILANVGAKFARGLHAGGFLRIFLRGVVHTPCKYLVK